MSDLLQSIEKYIPESIRGHLKTGTDVIKQYYNLSYQELDKFLKPYNLPISTDIIFYAILSIIFKHYKLTTYVILVFGGSSSPSSSSSSRHSKSKKIKRGNNILILGLSNSGKTSLFVKLTTGKNITTHSSINPNRGTFQIRESKKKLPIIDIPGNEKIKFTLPEFLQNAGCIIYVIDTTTFNEQSTVEAQYNKTDVAGGDQTSDLISSFLERELDEIRKTRTATPVVFGSEEEKKEIYLGIEDTAFQFDQLSNEVTFASGSSTQDSEFPEIESFISNSTQ
eukprot:gene566-711_t